MKKLVHMYNLIVLQSTINKETDMRIRTNCRTRNADLLTRVRLTESQRLTAQASMDQGERIAELILGAIAGIRAAGHWLERSLRAFPGSKPTH